MEFYRTQSTLKALKERKEIYAEEMTGLFLDLCRDVQDEMHMAAAKLPIREAEQASLCLCQMGQMYLYMLKNQEQVLAFSEKKEQLDKMEQAMTEKTKQLEGIQQEALLLLQTKERLAEELSKAKMQVGEKEKEVQELKKKWELRTAEKKQLEQMKTELQEKLEQVDFEKETAFIEEARHYADRMVAAWNAASRQMGILKQGKELEDLEKEMKSRRQQMEKGIESYRERMQQVIGMMEEAWKE